jgi:hypothetical protein
MSSKPKMRFCFNCGEQLGCDPYYDPLDTCGKTECIREANYAREAERAEAHEQLDRDRGW